MQYKSATECISATATILLIILICGVGLFDANAILFGMDQLLEASSTQLSAFVHWYFWFIHLGQQAVFGVWLLTLGVLSSLPIIHITLKEEHLIVTAVHIFVFLVWVVCSLLASYLFQQEKKHMACMLKRWVLTHSKRCGKS